MATAQRDGTVLVVAGEASADPARVIAIALNGTMQTLDSAPGDAIDPASLTVVDRTVSWTHSGAARATTV